MKPLRLRGITLAYAVCGAQLFLGLAAALTCYVIAGWHSAGAALYGAMTAILPSLYLAAKVFLGGRDDKPLQVLGAVYWGETGKILLVAVMFIIGAKLFPAHFLALMLTFIACLSVYGLMLAVSR